MKRLPGKDKKSQGFYLRYMRIFFATLVFYLGWLVIDAFMAEVGVSWESGGFGRLVFSKHRGTALDLKRVDVRKVVLKGKAQLTFVTQYASRDVTQNLVWEEAAILIRQLMVNDFGAVNLWTAQGTTQWLRSKKGKQILVRGGGQLEVSQAVAHDREKKRWVHLERPFLHALGVADAQGILVPALSRKWKQINKFVEIFERALQASGLADRRPAQTISVADFGSGKGYLTFAVHDYLQHGLGLAAQVTGVELRSDLVAFCSGVVHRLGLEGLAFDTGDIRTYSAQALDVVIALHACDVATDHAIHLGVRSGAAVILCSPCCHKEIRPQLLSPHPLQPILRHGVHLGQEAEMVTDGLRALLLEAAGYDTQVFEFISLEHTQKNKMILAVKRAVAGPSEPHLAQAQVVKDFYGIKHQCLETLLFGTLAAR
jgi:SAM-dependent methyltransferase